MKSISLLFLISGFFLTIACSNPANNEGTNTDLNQNEDVDTVNATLSNSHPEDLETIRKELLTKSDDVEVPVNMTNTEVDQIKPARSISPDKPKPSIVNLKNTESPIEKNDPVLEQQNIQEELSQNSNSAPGNIGNISTAEMQSQNETEKESTPAENKSAVDLHKTFDQLLQKYVTASGKVNYQGFKTEEKKLDAYLKTLDENPPTDDWSKQQKMAYWINAYNAGTIKLILKNYPVSSIMDLHNGKPWDQKWISLGGKTYTLNNIEHDILRPVYKDARIHFAVNCAAKSCPPLLNKAWTEKNLNQLLDQQTRAFINDTSQNKISTNAVELSKIFDWYAGDFGNIIDYLNKYSTTKINSDAKVTYKDYNWALNN